MASRFTFQNTEYRFIDLFKLADPTKIAKLPFCLKILLENLARHLNEKNKDGKNTTSAVTNPLVNQLVDWQTAEKTEIYFTPSRVILQDFTGVPAIVDLATLREALANENGSPTQINPLCPVDLVVDHSVTVDRFGTPTAFLQNKQLEYQRNEERYRFLKWAQRAFRHFRVVPPGTGIVHQVNLEYLSEVVCHDKVQHWLYPDTLVGTDSHTTMINGLGVLGWGVGGIEAEAAMLGEAITLEIPKVIGVEITGTLRPPACATDLVLTLVQQLRKKGVVGKFVEFYGPGLAHLPVADRATIANMSPEFGATCAIFPIDSQTLDYLKATGRPKQAIALVEHYARKQGLFQDANTPPAVYSDILKLNLSEVQPSIAGPKRPQDKILLKQAKSEFQKHLNIPEKAQPKQAEITLDNQPISLSEGDVVIAAITSCTNTSNPSVMIAAGLIAKAARAHGLKTQPWVKTSLAPGSQVVSDYLEKAGLMISLEQLGFHLVGYGCTTCIGNSGPLDPAIEQAIEKNKLSVCAVLSGNRNFEGRIHPLVKHAYLASPPLVVAYALAGTLNIDFEQDPIGYRPDKTPIFLKTLWPCETEIQRVLNLAISPELFQKRYQNVFKGDQQWEKLTPPQTDCYAWAANSTYVRKAPFLDAQNTQNHAHKINQARVLVLAGDSITTDHISPAGSISKNSPAGAYLLAQGLAPFEFNSYGARRGNHEVMIRGTFANIRFQNLLTPEKQGAWTKHHPSHHLCSIFEAAEKYRQANTPLIVIAGKEYGSGSSRDWAAKGPKLLGVKVVIAESFERIHRCNLIGMGILPLSFLPGDNPHTLDISGTEYFDFHLNNLSPNAQITVEITTTANGTKTFNAQVEIHTPKELSYYQKGGILPYVLEKFANKSKESA